MDIENLTNTELKEQFRIVATEMTSRNMLNEALQEFFNLTTIQYSHEYNEVIE